MKIFTNSLEGFFIRRPNRFIVEVETKKGRIKAHCPNPGRLQEILYPGVPVILELSENMNRKLPYTLVAAEHNCHIAPLYSLRANAAAKNFILPRLFPDALSIQSEHTFLSSRFDYFVTRKNEQRALIEIKHCSLIEHGSAMFPDAPTKRGLKHISELIEIQKSDPRTFCYIIFIITHGSPVRFIPNIHTDPDFALALRESISIGVSVHCSSFTCSKEGVLSVENLQVPLELSSIASLGSKKGVYFSFASVKNRSEIQYSPEWYIAVHKEKQPRRLRMMMMNSRIKTYPVYSNKPLIETVLKGMMEAGFRYRAGTMDEGEIIFRADTYPFHNLKFRELFFFLRHKGFI